jgi:hypothetical protein
MGMLPSLDALELLRADRRTAAGIIPVENLGVSRCPLFTSGDQTRTVQNLQNRRLNLRCTCLIVRLRRHLKERLALQ